MFPSSSSYDDVTLVLSASTVKPPSMCHGNFTSKREIILSVQSVNLSKAKRVKVSTNDKDLETDLNHAPATIVYLSFLTTMQLMLSQLVDWSAIAASSTLS